MEQARETEQAPEVEKAASLVEPAPDETVVQALLQVAHPTEFVAADEDTTDNG